MPTMAYVSVFELVCDAVVGATVFVVVVDPKILFKKPPTGDKNAFTVFPTSVAFVLISKIDLIIDCEAKGIFYRHLKQRN